MRTTASRSTYPRLVWLVAAAAWLLATAEAVYGVVALRYLDWWGFDLDIYRAATTRLFSGGSWFDPRQLAGSYTVANGDVLYPPATSFLFAPFLVLPTVLFVAVPIAIVAWSVWRWRPSALALAVIGVCLAWPTTQMRTVSANPALWAAAALALGLRWRGPAALILLKPTLIPFALAGVGSRGWLVGVAVLAVASLVFLSQTLLYPGVLLRAQNEFGPVYLLADIPLMLIPLAAWLGSEERAAGRGSPQVAAGDRG